jgi:rhodanese-related sulfurtransferase
VAVSVKRRTLDELLADAQERIVRYTPAQAHSAAQSGALLIDIRSDSDRERDGIVPGSLHIPRTVLEWRTDLDSPWRNPHLGGLAQQLILLCDHGCSTILAAATLTELGYSRAGDVIGGYAGWQEAGLPTTTAQPNSRPGEPAGMSAPDPV